MKFERRTITLAVGVVAIAALSRFYALNRIPPGIYPDEAIKGNEGLEAVQTADFKIFYPENNGREGLWINLVGLSVSAFGNNQHALRLWSALLGTLTVLAVYLLARSIFSDRVALFASWFTATSFWHLNFSRIAFRAILVPLLVTASLYFLIRAWQKSKERTAGFRVSFLIAAIGGGLYGLGFHTYIAFRVTPLLIAPYLVLAYLEWRGRHPAGRWLALTGTWLATAILVALPIGFYFLRHPQDFLGRAGGVSIFSAERPLREFGRVLWQTAGMFHVRGDCNWRHNLACAPQVALPVGVLFALGAALAVRKTIRKGEGKPAAALLLVWLIVLLIPELLTREGTPHALRAIGVIPAVFLLAALGADALWSKLDRKAWRGAFLAALLLTGAFEFYRYFGVWAGRPETAGAFTQHLVRIGQHLNALPPTTPRYVIVNEDGVLVPHRNPDGKTKFIPMPAETVMFVTKNGAPATYLLSEDLDHAILPSGSVIVPLRAEERLWEQLERRELKIRKSAFKDFVAATVIE